MNNARKRDPQATRQKILEAAKTLLVDGSGGIEMSWVAKQAGVSQGLAYHYFNSKEGLMSAVVNDFYDRVDDAVLMARFEDESDWEVRERSRTQKYIEFLVEDPLARVVMTRLSGTPAVAAVEAERWQKLVTAGSKNMADGQHRGVVEPGVDPTVLASLTLGAVRSAVTTQFLNEKEIEPEQLTQTIWQFIRRGLCLS